MRVSLSPETARFDAVSLAGAITDRHYHSIVPRRPRETTIVVKIEGREGIGPCQTGGGYRSPRSQASILVKASDDYPPAGIWTSFPTSRPMIGAVPEQPS